MRATGRKSRRGEWLFIVSICYLLFAAVKSNEIYLHGTTDDTDGTKLGESEYPGSSDGTSPLEAPCDVGAGKKK